jgi:hypothetical protein
MYSLDRMNKFLRGRPRPLFLKLKGLNFIFLIVSNMKRSNTKSSAPSFINGRDIADFVKDPIYTKKLILK